MEWKSLKTRMLVLILGMSALVFTTTILLIAFFNRQNSVDFAIELSNSKSNELVSQMQKYLEHPLEVSKNIVNSFNALRKQNNKNRKYYDELINIAFEKNEDLLCVYSMWEPNALDGNDEEYEGVFPYDEEGRFNYSTYRDGKRNAIEQTSVDEYDEDYYKLAASTQLDVINEPYFYSYSGEEGPHFFETSIVTPIIENGKTLGVMGADIDLKSLSEIIGGIKLFNSGYGILLSNEGVIAAHKNKEMLEQKFIDVFDFASNDMMSAIKKGEKFQAKVVSKKDKNEYFLTLSPIQIGNSTTPWSLCIIIPESEVLMSANALMSRGLLLGLIGLVIMSILIYTQANGIVKPIFQAVEQAKAVANGNLEKVYYSKRKDELGHLQQSLKIMNDKLRNIVEQLQQTIGNMVNTSDEINSVSQRLSQGSNELASSSEEVSSTMEEIVSNIEQNSQNASETTKLTESLAVNALRVKEASEQSVDSIKTIAAKVSIINDIAFQTNILALNAAVEAARAGEHGKGFAVVAGEVRKLAERSKVAAEEINHIAMGSVALTEESTKLLNEIIPHIQNTNSLIQEIAAASREQNTGVDQVNISVQQFSSITQQNASVSEELASSAEEMKTQAGGLKDLISYFKF